MPSWDRAVWHEDRAILRPRQSPPRRSEVLAKRVFGLDITDQSGYQRQEPSAHYPLKFYPLKFYPLTDEAAGDFAATWRGQQRMQLTLAQPG